VAAENSFKTLTAAAAKAFEIGEMHRGDFPLMVGSRLAVESSILCPGLPIASSTVELCRPAQGQEHVCRHRT